MIDGTTRRQVLTGTIAIAAAPYLPPVPAINWRAEAAPFIARIRTALDALNKALKSAELEGHKEVFLVHLLNNARYLDPDNDEDILFDYVTDLTRICSFSGLSCLRMAEDHPARPLSAEVERAGRAMSEYLQVTHGRNEGWPDDWRKDLTFAEAQVAIVWGRG